MHLRSWVHGLRGITAMVYLSSCAISSWLGFWDFATRSTSTRHFEFSEEIKIQRQSFYHHPPSRHTSTTCQQNPNIDIVIEVHFPLQVEGENLEHLNHPDRLVMLDHPANQDRWINAIHLDYPGYPRLKLPSGRPDDYWQRQVHTTPDSFRSWDVLRQRRTD